MSLAYPDTLADEAWLRELLRTADVYRAAIKTATKNGEEAAKIQNTREALWLVEDDIRELESHGVGVSFCW
jgi:hypothetical protein